MEMKKFKPVNFELFEVLPKDFYDKYYPVYGENLWWIIFSYEIRYTIDSLRKFFGRATINNWKWQSGDGGNHYRGYRPLDCKIGAKLSQHKMGNAVDISFVHYSAEEVRNEIFQRSENEYFKYITCIEMNVSWLHVDCRELNPAQSRILKIYP